MVDEPAVRVEHYAAEVKIDILHRFPESEKSLRHDGAPVAAYAEVGELGAIALFEIYALPFFKTNCHDVEFKWLNLICRKIRQSHSKVIGKAFHSFNLSEETSIHPVICRLADVFVDKELQATLVAGAHCFEFPFTVAAVEASELHSRLDREIFVKIILGNLLVGEGIVDTDI